MSVDGERLRECAWSEKSETDGENEIVLEWQEGEGGEKRDCC